MANDTHIDHLKRRALRHASRGDLRKAVLALRERAALVDDGASWVMLGVMLRRVGRRDPGRAERGPRGRPGPVAQLPRIARAASRISWHVGQTG